MTPEMMKYWQELWVKELKNQLTLSKYAFSPGYNNSSPQRNKFTGNKISTGSLYNSIEGDVTTQDDAITLELYMLSYWRYVNDGVRPSTSFPTSGYVPRGGTSEFISSLVEWYGQKLGIRGKEALGRAFGTRMNIWRFGIAPSEFYTNTLDIMIEKMTDEFGEQWFDYMTELITNRILD